MIKALNYFHITVTKDRKADVYDNRIEKDCIKIRAQDGDGGTSIYLTPESAKQLIDDIECHLATGENDNE